MHLCSSWMQYQYEHLWKFVTTTVWITVCDLLYTSEMEDQFPLLTKGAPKTLLLVTSQSHEK